MERNTPADRRPLHRRRFLGDAAAAAVAGLGLPGSSSASSSASPAAPAGSSPAALAVSLVASRILPAPPGGQNRQGRPAPPDRPPYLREIHLDAASPVLLVALRNTSGSPVRVWDEGNSWGFENLRVEVTAEDGAPPGRPAVVRRATAGWGGNGPVYSVLPPGETLVRTLPLARGGAKEEEQQQRSVWGYGGFPFAPDGQQTRLRMRAVYQVAPGQQAARLGVWTGQAASPVDDYLVTVLPAR